MAVFFFFYLFFVVQVYVNLFIQEKKRHTFRWTYNQIKQLFSYYHISRRLFTNSIKVHDSIHIKELFGEYKGRSLYLHMHTKRKIIWYDENNKRQTLPPEEFYGDHDSI